LADRFLQHCQTISARNMRNQVLDDMDLERERGITIKARAVTLEYQSRDNQTFMLNLIDTPGHVDFSYEVNRSLAACEGVLLLVDATQGIQAQTMANLHLARKNNLTIIGVINKVDMANADIPGCRAQMIQLAQIKEDYLFSTSAKTGHGVQDLLEAIVKNIPPPPITEGEEVKALIFDSVFDAFRGVIVSVRVVMGELKLGDQIYLMQTGRSFEILDLGIFCPQPQKKERLGTGMVGYVVANIRDPECVKIGETMTMTGKGRAGSPLHGFSQSKPMVFSGLYPIDPDDFEALKNSLEKLRLNDSALVFESETSVALGFGFRVGFLGLLHMEIVQERIDREYGIGIIMTSPSVVYHVMDISGEIYEVDNPSKLPSGDHIVGVDEPYVKAKIVVPTDNIGSVVRLCTEKRGELLETESLLMDRVLMKYLLPLAEILTDFYDKLKSSTKGFGSLDYEPDIYRPTHVVKMDILLNGDVVDAFSSIVYHSKAPTLGRDLIARLKEVIPRHLFAIPIQAAIGQKIIARETIRALRKNVIAKCYGGDITRKKKLLEKQKKGKKRMKLIGKVQVPKNAFMEVLKNG